MQELGFRVNRLQTLREGPEVSAFSKVEQEWRVGGWSGKGVTAGLGVEIMLDGTALD